MPGSRPTPSRAFGRWSPLNLEPLEPRILLSSPTFAQLTDLSTGGCGVPAISTDGNRIAFTANTLGNNPEHNFEVFLYDLATSSLTQVTETSSGDVPYNVKVGIDADGDRLAFAINADPLGGNPDGNYEVFLYDADSDSLAQITDTTGSLYECVKPSINGDGTLIAFQSRADLTGQNSEGNSEIYLYDTNTATLSLVTDAPAGNSSWASISADGQRMAFVSNAYLRQGEGMLNQAFLWDAGTSSITRISDPQGTGGSTQQLAISADGSRVAFYSDSDLTGGNADRSTEVFLYTTATGTIEQLTDTSLSAPGNFFAFPSPNADGSRIVFASSTDLTGDYPDMEIDVFAYDVAALTKLTQLTSGNAGSSAPSVSGDGTRVALQSNADLTGGNPDGTAEVFLVSLDPPPVEAGSIQGQEFEDFDGDGVEDPGEAGVGEGRWTLGGTTVYLDLDQDGVFDPGEPNTVTAPDGAYGFFGLAPGEYHVREVVPAHFAQTAPSGGVHVVSVVAGAAVPDADFGNQALGYVDPLTQVTVTPYSGLGGEIANFTSFGRSISADGTRIAFVSSADLAGANPDGNYELFLYDTVSDVFSQVTDTASPHGGPGMSVDISRDGSRIAFASTADLTGQNPAGAYEVFLYDVSSDSIVQVTQGVYGGGAISLSADGTLLCFRSSADITGDNPDLGDEIFVYNAYSDDFTQVTNDTPGGLWAPMISASGTMIAYVSDGNATGENPDRSEEIFSLSVPDGTVKQLTDTTNSFVALLGMSADGQRILFQSNTNATGENPDDSSEVFLYDGFVDDVIQVTNDPDPLSISGTGGAISGDGSRVIFTSPSDLTGENPDGGQQIFLYDTWTDSLTQLTDGVGSSLPSVDDSGSRVVFSSAEDLTGDNPDFNTEVFLTLVPPRWGPALVHQFTCGDTVVSIWDAADPVDIDANDVRVVFGPGCSVAAIVLGGTQPMEGLGITISGAPSVGSIVDARLGSRGELAFLASDAPVTYVNLRSDLIGYNLNGLSLGGIAFAEDIDGDGLTDDATGVHVAGPLQTLLVTGDCRGDTLVGGKLGLATFTNGALSGELRTDGIGVLQVLGGDLNGDVILTGGNVGTVTTIAVGGRGGSIMGDIVTPNGDVSTVMAIGGGIAGSIQAPTGSVGTVMAINGAVTSPTIYGQTGVNLVQAINGGVASSITSGASLGTVMAISGGISGSIQAPTGKVGTVMAIGGAITSPTIYGQTGVNLVQAINGGVASSITSGGSIGSVMAIAGDLDLRSGRSISAGGTINALMAINGDILGDGVTSPDIYVGNGNLWSLQAVNGGMQSVWVDVNGAGASSGRLGSVYVGGSVTNSLFEADGLLSSLFSLGSFTNSSVQTGSLSVVYVGGTISEDSSDGDEDAIHADTGSYFVIDSTKFAQITPTEPDTFSGVVASVG